MKCHWRKVFNVQGVKDLYWTVGVTRLDYIRNDAIRQIRQRFGVAVASLISYVMLGFGAMATFFAPVVTLFGTYIHRCARKRPEGGRSSVGSICCMFTWWLLISTPYSIRSRKVASPYYLEERTPRRSRTNAEKEEVQRPCLLYREVSSSLG